MAAAPPNLKNAPNHLSSKTQKCRCCPYGYHIDLDFVHFAEDVNKGFATKKTPTLPRKKYNFQNGQNGNGSSNGDRSLMSPLDSILGDSLENILSDFDEALGDRDAHGHRPPLVKQSSSYELRTDRLQNGYLSDYTGYRTGSAMNNVKMGSIGLEPLTGLAKPIRSNGNGASLNGRSTPTAYTALGRTISEIKARNTDSPLPPHDRECYSRNGTSCTIRTLGDPASRVGTPIDLGIPLTPIANGNGQHFTIPNVSNGSHYHPNGHISTPNTPIMARFQGRDNGKESDRPSQLPPMPTNGNSNGPAWRRAPTSGDMKNDQFASLRRGREYALSDGEGMQHRVRYYSASPKMPRKLQPVPPLAESEFTYTQQDGHTKLAKSQGTSMSPREEQHPVTKSTRSVAVSTGPLPPAKPCSECPNLKKELEKTLEKIKSKPKLENASTITESEKKIESKSIGVETNKSKLSDRGSDAWRGDLKETFSQTDPPPSCSSVFVMAKPWVLSIAMQTDEEKTTQEYKNEEGKEADREEERKATKGNEPEHLPTTKQFVTQETSTDTIMMDEVIKSPETTNQEVMTNRIYYRNIESQTDRESTPVPHFAPPPRPQAVVLPKVTFMKGTQTDNDAILEVPQIPKINGHNNKEVKENGNTENYQACPECAKKKEVFSRNVGVGCCSVEDRICISCDEHMDEVDENDAPGLGLEVSVKPKEYEITRAAAVKKLLTTENTNQKHDFVRGSAVSRSARFERRKSADSLDYVEQQSKASSAPPTTPSGESSDALKSKVNLKKDPPTIVSCVPEPIPARIPRPKITRYVPPQNEEVEPDEAEEAADKLTPLRCEMRTLSSWPRSSPHMPYPARHEESSSDSDSDISEGSYDTNEDQNGHSEAQAFEISTPLREALESLNSHLLQPGTVSSDTADWALKYVQHEWLKTAARKNSRSDHVDTFVEVLRELGPVILKTVVNITDQNANTALHYAVSHGNFAVVSSLLDSSECQLNLCNKAGYTAVMLAALCGLEDEIEKAVVQRLFEMGDVNARATQHGQTALMLSVSHGKRATTELLLQCGANVNIQDEEGSTALMCAAEHGHKELVKLLLSRKEINATLTDCDSSTALSIALENGHNDIGVLIYAHINYTRNEVVEESAMI